MNVSHPTKFVPGPMPRNSLAPHGAMYSGLLECPVTTRIRKLVDGGYVPLSRGSCQHPIQSAAECFAAGGRPSRTRMHAPKRERAHVYDRLLPAPSPLSPASPPAAPRLQLPPLSRLRRRRPATS